MFQNQTLKNTGRFALAFVFYFIVNVFFSEPAFITPVTFLICAGVLLWYIKPTITIPKKWLKFILLILSLALGVIIFNIVWNAFVEPALLGHYMTSNNQSTINNQLTDKKTAFFLILNIVFFAPIIEETLFRGAIVNRLTIKKLPYFDVILSGLLFGYLHVIDLSSLRNLVDFASYSAVGLIFAFTYKKTNNLATTISAHMLVNIVSILPLVIH